MVLGVPPRGSLRLARNAKYVPLLEMKSTWMCYDVNLVKRGREGEGERRSGGERKEGMGERDANRYKLTERLK